MGDWLSRMRLWRMRSPGRLRRLISPPVQLTWQGDGSPRDQRERAEQLQAARRQAEAVGKAMAKAERELKKAAWRCVESGHSYPDTAALAGVDVETAQRWVAEVSDSWGSPVGV